MTKPVPPTAAAYGDLDVGDLIEHRLMPGFTMPVEDVDACETDANRREPHARYQVTDPDGQTDWLCSHDVIWITM